MDHKGEELTVPLHEEVKKSFLDYAMSVIVSRALPDVRDGLKPVHRRILYALQELGIGPDKPHKKSARIVGEVLGKYHPHGDQAVYEAMVRLAQDFSMRYPLVDGQGNFGSMDGDSAAAMRYTEARLSPLAMEMLRDLEKETVDFRPNFDETLEEPEVLPSRFPNLLVNGSAGIAVGMATSIPPHNLSEVIEALTHLIENPGASVEDLLHFIKGPDFPTGGSIIGKSGIQEAYTTGKGTIKMRGKVTLERTKENKDRILVTEVPYQQNKAKLIEKIAELVREKRIEGINELRDESDRNGVRIVIELRRGYNPQVILNQLYKFTPLQQSFGITLLALVDGTTPRVLNLKQVLEAYLEHQKEIIVRRSQYLLRKAKERAHIVEGLRIALNYLDDVIALIRGAENVESARSGLMERFELSQKQAQAILDMRLQKLTALEREKLEEEYRSLKEEIAYLEALLADESLIMKEIKSELIELNKKYGDDRLTDIAADEGEIDTEDLIPDEKVVVTLTHQGYIKRLPLTTYRSQRRGGKGILAHSIRDKDFIEHLFISSSRDKLLCFSNVGKVYPLKVYEIPEAGRTARGTAIINLLPLNSGEYITAIYPLGEFDSSDHLVMATKSGLVKKSQFKDFASVRRSGLIAITLQNGDELISVKQLHRDSNSIAEEEDQDVLMLSSQGFLIRFPVTQVRQMGRSAMGVRGIKLAENDWAVALNLVSKNDEELLFVTENGYGKRTKVEEFKRQSRGGRGIIALKPSPRSGPLVSFHPVKGKKEFIIVTARGLIIREKISQVSRQGRYAKGVTLIKLSPDDKVVNLAVMADD